MSMDTVSWRVPVKVPVAKLVVAGIITLLAVAVGGGELWPRVLAAVVVVGMVAWAVRDLVAPVRVAAGPDGLTLVTGFARRHRLEWPQVDRVRVDTRLRSRMLEVDTGEALFRFSRYDLDADLDEVAARLEAVRPR